MSGSDVVDRGTLVAMVYGGIRARQDELITRLRDGFSWMSSFHIAVASGEGKWRNGRISRQEKASDKTTSGGVIFAKSARLNVWTMPRQRWKPQRE